MNVFNPHKETMFTYKFPRPALTVDIVVFNISGPDIKVLLIERGGEPFKGMLALPGGYVEIKDDELCIDAAVRELQEETGIKKSTDSLKEVGFFDDPKRNPLGRVLSMAYYTIVTDTYAVAQDDAVRTEWCPVERIIQNPKVELAFDHEEIVRKAYERFIG